jgi:hypothetical protein
MFKLATKLRRYMFLHKDRGNFHSRRHMAGYDLKIMPISAIASQEAVASSDHGLSTVCRDRSSTE